MWTFWFSSLLLVITEMQTENICIIKYKVLCNAIWKWCVIVYMWRCYSHVEWGSNEVTRDITFKHQLVLLILTRAWALVHLFFVKDVGVGRTWIPVNVQSSTWSSRPLLKQLAQRKTAEQPSIDATRANLQSAIVDRIVYLFSLQELCCTLEIWNSSCASFA